MIKWRAEINKNQNPPMTCANKFLIMSMGWQAEGLAYALHGPASEDTHRCELKLIFYFFFISHFVTFLPEGVLIGFQNLA